MTVFIIVALLLVVAALLFLVPPLIRREPGNPVERGELNVSIYRDQLAELERDLRNDTISREQYEQGREELERRLLEDVADAGDAPSATRGGRSMAGALTVALGVPAVAVGLYLLLGMPAVLSPERPAPDGTADGAGSGDIARQINQMVARLEQRLEDEPGNAEGWAMLGRSYLVLERFEEARAALEKAVALDDSNPQALVDYADVLALTTGQSLEGRPVAMIERALEIDPNNQKALWLAGTAAYERADYRRALDYWRRLYALVPKGSAAAQAMEGNIAEVEALLAGKAPPAASPTPGQAGKRVRGTVRLADGLRDKVKDSDTVFIFARAPQGPRMPLAVMRAQVRDLPLAYSLDDTQAMDASLSISRFPEVVVVARISRSGSAAAQSGDLQGESTVVKTGGEAPVDVVIDEVVP